jgi:hypothetical protein
MNFKPHSRIERTLGAGLALAITLAGLTILVHGFLPGNDDALVAKRQHLEAIFERLNVARAFAQGDVKQAAVDALPQTH